MDSYNVTEQSLYLFNCLPLTNLSMLFVREDHFMKGHIVEEWPDTALSEDSDAGLDDTGVDDTEGSRESSAEASEPALDLWVWAERDTRFSMLNPATVSVLDRLPDGGASLTKLGFCLRLEK